MNRILIISMAIFTLFACKSDRLCYALKLAGDNRGELEKVLSHYSGREDSLKLKAAIFLIENMPGHYSYSGDEIDEYYNEIDTVLNDKDIAIDEYHILLSEASARHPNIRRSITQDINIIDSEFLIYNIDKAFELWGKPWAQHLSFDEFCEALLPYKVCELQELSYWRDTLSAKYPLINRHPDNEEYTISPYQHYEDILNKIESANPFNIDLRGDNYYIPLSSSNIYKTRAANCATYVSIITSIMRSNGLPIYQEYFPSWGKAGNMGHSYLSLVNKSGINLPYEYTNSKSYTGIIHQYYNIPKVYRKTYAHNLERLDYFRNAKYVDNDIPMFVQDITDDHFSTSDISVDISTRKLKDDYVYLSFYVYGGLRVLDCAKKSSRKVSFKNVGRYNLYVIQGYDGEQLVPISKPFILTSSGDIRYLQADKENLQSVKLFRKYYKQVHLYDLDELAMGSVEASNSPDFKSAKTLCKNITPGRFVAINNQNKFRYWRFIPPHGARCNISEFQIFQTDSVCPIKGRVISNCKDESLNSTVHMAFDGDWLTNVDESQEVWVGLDAGTPISVDRVLCIQRTDDNNIHIGDEYELRYWSDNGWCVLGRQVALDSPLIFNNVPRNTVYWLANITRGNQERAFTYENDMQVWW